MKNLKKQIDRVHEAMEICISGDVYDILSEVHENLQTIYYRVDDSINGVKEEPSRIRDLWKHVGTWVGQWDKF